MHWYEQEKKKVEKNGYAKLQKPENAQDERKKDQESKTKDFVTYQNGMRITNAQPKNWQATIAEKGHFAKVCRFKHRQEKEIKILTQPEVTKENDTTKN